MSNWPLNELRVKIAELARSGVGGLKLLELLANGSSCASTECDQLDFKLQVNDDDVGIAETCRDVAAFHNMYGGFIVVGIAETSNESFEVVGTSAGFDVERVKNKLRDFTGERVLVTQDACTWDISPGKSVQIFVLNIPARDKQSPPLAFVKDGPGKGLKGRRIFEKVRFPFGMATKPPRREEQRWCRFGRVDRIQFSQAQKSEAQHRCLAYLTIFPIEILFALK